MIKAAVTEFGALILLWILFVSKTAAGEILVGCAATLVTVIGLEVSKRAEPPRFRPPLLALAQAWRIPGQVLQGTWTLTQDLARRMLGGRSRSVLRLAPFKPHGTRDRATAIRALAVIYVTFPPNFLIVGIDDGTNLMLYHQVRKEPVPEIIHRLESA